MAKHMKRRKGRHLSAAHRKAISEGLKRHHRGGGKRKNHRRERGKLLHKRRIRHLLNDDRRKGKIKRARARRRKRTRVA